MPDQNIEVMQRHKVFRDADKVHYNVKFNEAQQLVCMILFT